MRVWQLQKAKAQLSEVVRQCLRKGPQVLSVRGQEEIVMLAKKDYERLVGKKPNFIDFMNQSPLKGIDLSIERARSSERETDI